MVAWDVASGALLELNIGLEIDLYKPNFELNSSLIDAWIVDYRLRSSRRGRIAANMGVLAGAANIGHLRVRFEALEVVFLVWEL